VKRQPSKADERSVTVSITPAGRKLVRQVVPGHVAVVRQLLLDSLNPRDLATLSGILGGVRDQMRTAPPRSAAPRARQR